MPHTQPRLTSVSGVWKYNFHLISTVYVWRINNYKIQKKKKILIKLLKKIKLLNYLELRSTRQISQK